MSRVRFLAIIGRRDPLGKVKGLAQACEAAGLVRVIDTSLLKLFADAPESHALISNRCAVLGDLYTQKTPIRRVAALCETDMREIDRSHGHSLITDYWGSYVAFLVDDSAESARVLRAPFGQRACFHASVDALTIVVSDVALLASCAGMVLACDWPMVSRHIASKGLRQDRTCLVGIEELLGGSCLVASRDGVHVEAVWSPWDFVWPGGAVPDPVQASDMLRETAQQCVAAQADGFDNVLSMLSGGLDSSILAWCLQHSGAKLSCLTLTMGDLAGDERAYAGMVTESLGVPLIEAAHDIADVDIGISAASHLPFPVTRSFYQATRKLKRDVAQSIGADIVFDGGGGDNVFCFLQSVAPVADRLRVHGPGPGAWRTACDIARMAETSVPLVLAKAARRAWLRRPGYRWQIDHSYLAGDAVSEAQHYRSHRWLSAPWRALPGAAAHIALLVAVENLLETADGALPERAPLVAQPLVQLCLGLPSWLWCAGGNNRQIARDAFTGLLPQAIVERRTKGSPDGFVAALYEARREELAALLLDGVLARQGLIDRKALARRLSDPAPVKGHDHGRILRLADVEAWARSF